MTAWLVRHRLAVLICALLPLPFLIFGYLNVQSVLKSIVGSNDEAQSTIVSKKLAERFSRQVQFMAQVTFHHDKLTVDDTPYEKSVVSVNQTVSPDGSKSISSSR